MPITPVSVPKYPNVPRAPGVPPVVRNPSPDPLALINDLTLLAADAEFLFSLFGPPQWGIYNSDNQLVLAPDSILAVEFRKDWQVSDYPQEQGAFASYNRVEAPFAVKVTMTKGGSDAERHAFLTDIEIVSQTLGLYDVVMPDKTYSSVNLDHYDFRRTALNGVGLLTVDIWLTEIRVTGTAEFSKTAQPSGADPVNGGNVYPVEPVTVTPLPAIT